MSSKNILLIGATGETGRDVLNGLLEDGSFVSHHACNPFGTSTLGTTMVQNLPLYRISHV
jgi:hypothetical protein